MKKIIYSAITITVLFFCFCFSASAATAGKVITQGGRLNLRTSPSTTAGVIKSVPHNSWLTIIEKSGSWYLVEYEKDKRAYAHSSYIKNYTSTVEAYVKLNSGYLNVRNGPGRDYGVKDKLYNGKNVLAVKSNETWTGILYDGNKIGYVARAYLAKKGTEAYPQITLSVPSFKQTDSRWSNYPLGTQGDTIGTIGCLTTAIAMVESYNTKSTITPPQMAKKLSYSASGSLYWPANYMRINATSGYLGEIHSLLKQGKPVILGAKKASGGQHWVTVYGYEGSGSLSPSGFKIHDPGSNSRFTLQAFLSQYPYADRFVYVK